MDTKRTLFSETYLMFFFFFAFASLCNNVDAVTYFNVIDYGAKPDGVTDSTYVCAKLSVFLLFF